jgi:hypothetical protein
MPSRRDDRAAEGLEERREMTRRRNRSEAGFIVTLELIIIFSILGIGLMVGVVALRDALIKHALLKKNNDIYVIDSSDPAKLLGKAYDMDEHEAPRLLYIDLASNPNSPPPVNQRAVIGVRDDRFTSRHRIFYENSLNCGITGTDVRACIVRAGDETGDNRGLGIIGFDGVDSVTGNEVTGAGRIANAGGIGYLYAMQSLISYGIGREIDAASPGVGPFRTNHPGLPGTLYRETEDSCDPAVIRSVWTSQYVTETSGALNVLPCETLPGGATVEAAKCPDGRSGANAGDPCLPPADSRCVTAGGAGSGTCSNSPGTICTVDSNCSLNLCSVSGAACTGNADCAGTCTNGSTSCQVNGDCPSVGICTRGVNTGHLCTDIGVTDGQCGDEPGNNWVCVATPGACVGAQGSCTANNGTCNISGGGALVCACPSGWIDYGANCCPPGTIQATPGQCTLANNGQIAVATPVLDFDGNDALQKFEPPFHVNVPIDPNIQGFAITPSGTEGVPGTVSPTPIVGDVTPQYGVPPANGENGPP